MKKSIFEKFEPISDAKPIRQSKIDGLIMRKFFNDIKANNSSEPSLIDLFFNPPRDPNLIKFVEANKGKK